MSENNINEQQAIVLFDRAYHAQMRANLGDAIELYQRSIAAYPTAEAYTHLGWSYSMMGRYDEAIEQCHEAIIVDPDYGNPYNDIGAYMIEKRDYVEAIPWLEKAIVAPRYLKPHYPLTNLGRIYGKLGQISKALDFFDQALAIDPMYRPASWAKRSLMAKFN